MTSVAANIVSNASSVVSGATPIAAASGDDGFAAMLGDMLQAPSGDIATGTPANDTSAAATPTPTQTSATTQATDPNALFLQEMASADPTAVDATAPETTAAASPATTDDNPITDLLATDSSDDSITAATSKPVSFLATADDRPTRPSLRPGKHSEPARVPADAITAADGDDDATPAPASDPAAASDPATTPLAAAQQAMPVTSVASTPVPAASASDTPNVDTAPLVNPTNPPAAPATDIAAKGVLSGGATVKPGKTEASNNAVPADGEKSQTQATTAAAVADLGKAASRLFTDERASTAHALPVHGATDQPKNNSQSGDSPSGRQNPNTAATNAAVPAQAAETPAASTVIPTHAQAAPQPDASAAVSAASTTTAPAASIAANAPPAAPGAAQLQVTHPSAQPDINALAFTIATKSDGGARHFDIRLDPAELGRVDVRLTVDHAGQAQAALSVEKPQTLELLQKDQSHLERALKDAGLDLTQNGLSFSLKGQQQQNAGAGNDSSPRGRQLAVRAIAAAGEAASQLSFGGVAASDSRLDIRV